MNLLMAISKLDIAASWINIVPIFFIVGNNGVDDRIGGDFV